VVLSVASFVWELRIAVCDISVVGLETVADSIPEGVDLVIGRGAA